MPRFIAYWEAYNRIGDRQWSKVGGWIGKQEKSARATSAEVSYDIFRKVSIKRQRLCGERERVARLKTEW